MSWLEFLIGRTVIGILSERSLLGYSVIKESRTDSESWVGRLYQYPPVNSTPRRWAKPSPIPYCGRTEADRRICIGCKPEEPLTHTESGFRFLSQALLIITCPIPFTGLLALRRPNSSGCSSPLISLIHQYITYLVTV